MNFGPIVEAKIDLRPLTVFIGPSNTGKSYLAILIYALHRYFSGGRWHGHRRIPRDLGMFLHDGNQKLSLETFNSIVVLGEQILQDKEKPLSGEGIILPVSVVDIIRSGFGKQGDYLGSEIGRCFGITEAGALIRKGIRKVAHIDFRRHNTNELVPIDHRLTIHARASELKTIIPEDTQLKIGNGDDDYPFKYLRRLAMELISLGDLGDQRTRFFARRLLNGLADNVRSQVVGPLDLPAFYLPADRTGVMHAHSVVVSALIESASKTGLRPAARTPMLSGILADFLEQLIELDSPQYRQRKPSLDHGT